MRGQYFARIWEYYQIMEKNIGSAKRKKKKFGIFYSVITHCEKFNYREMICWEKNMKDDDIFQNCVEK